MLTKVVNAWVAHRNTDVYGSDADLWRPERWFEIEESGRAGYIEKYSFAFGQGSRSCMGKNISLLEISTLIPKLVRDFDFQLDDELVDQDWKILNRWFTKQVNFKVKVKLRQK